MEEIACDVLVVGAGPAGSTAAATAAASGARVLLLERKAEVGLPVRCAGYVAKAIRWHVDLPDECIAQSIDGLRTFLPDGSAHETEVPGYTLHRARLDRHLALRAVEAGASFFSNATAIAYEGNCVLVVRHTGLDDLGSGSFSGRVGRSFPEVAAEATRECVPAEASTPGCAGNGELQRATDRCLRQSTPGCAGNGGFTLNTLRSGGFSRNFRVRARVVVGADGPRSAVARWMGLPHPRLARAVQYEVELEHRLFTAEVYFRPAFRGGYAWLFPAGRSARVGAAFVGGSREAIAGLRSLLRELEAGGKVRGPALSLTAGLVPVGGPSALGGLRRENLLLVGDAAGQTHPITGAGVLNAIVAGEMAGRAAAESALAGRLDSLEEYEEECRFVLGPGLERAREKRCQLERAWNSSPVELAKTIRRSWITFDEYYSR